MSEYSPASTTIPQSLLDRLAPDYRAFVEAQPPTRWIPLHTIQWTSEFRQASGAPPDLGEADPVPVGSERTIQLGQFSVSVLTPEGERPSEVWPVLLFIHGGGWVFGTVDSGKPFYSRACGGRSSSYAYVRGFRPITIAEAKCVVVSVDYRLAPEHSFPTAVDDCWEALLWLRGSGKDELGIHVSRIAVGGVSS